MLSTALGEHVRDLSARRSRAGTFSLPDDEMAAPRTEPIAKSQPDKVVKHEKVQVRMYEINKRIIGYGVCEPGWRWSTHVKPHTGGDVCQCEHTGFVLRGRMVCQWKDGRTVRRSKKKKT